MEEADDKVALSLSSMLSSAVFLSDGIAAAVFLPSRFGGILLHVLAQCWLRLWFVTCDCWSTIEFWQVREMTRKRFYYVERAVEHVPLAKKIST